MSTQGQAWVDKIGIKCCKNAGELLVLMRVGNHVGGDMCGCFAKASTLAKECLMGESTVLKHLRRLKAGGVLLAGDAKLVDHIRADKRPPVYDLAGGHRPGCPGGHSSDVLCETAMTSGARCEHPGGLALAAGGQSKHPRKRRSSTGVRSEYPADGSGATGGRIDASRVSETSGRSSKEMKLSLSPPPGRLNSLSSAGPPPRRTRGVEGKTCDTSPRERGTAVPAASVPPPRRDVEGLPRPTALEADVRAVMAAYATALGAFPAPSVGRRLRGEAQELLTLGWPVAHVAELIGQLPGLGYTSLTRHADHNPPRPPAGVHPASAQGDGAPALCGRCEDGFVYRDPELKLGPRRCECRTGPARAS